MMISRTSTVAESPIPSSKSLDEEQAQVVDYEGNFLGGIEKKLSEWGLSNIGFKFSVVTVLGCQSSGKSTLLNSLFGTRFPELDATQGRRQTTQGIWMSHDFETPTLIVDVEGTDSKERGEDRLTFEHRASLFSLAIADAVIINMWYHDLGRYTASNYGLLKTVLAVNLELFQRADKETPKTTLYFIIRDFSPRITSIKILEEMILRDVAQIWSEIKKPKNLADTRASDFFSFICAGLPSKIVEPESFEESVKNMKQLWITKVRPASYSRHVPSDGFVFYAKSIWETILSRAELDIPSQKAMVATYRCEAIKNAAILAQQTRFESMGENTFVNETAQNIIKEAVQQYHREAWRYQEDVYLAKRGELCDALYMRIQRQHIDHYLIGFRQTLLKAKKDFWGSQCARAVGESFITMACGEKVTDFWKSIYKRFGEWRLLALEEFDSQVEKFSICVDICVEDENAGEPLELVIKHKFDTTIARLALEEGIDEILRQHFEAEKKCFFDDYLMAELDESLLEEVQGLMVVRNSDFDTESFWKNVTATLVNELQRIKAQSEIIWSEGFQEKAPFEPVLTIHSVKHFRDRLVSNLLDYLHQIVGQRFTAFFEQDADGIPHQWTALDQSAIKKFYLEAKKEAEKLLPAMKEFALIMDELNLQDVPEAEISFLKRPLMTEAKSAEILAKAQRVMLKQCQDAQLMQATGGRVQSPGWWWWLILCILGYNEFMSIIRSPVFTVLALLVAGTLAFTYFTGNIFVLLEIFRNGLQLVLSFIVPFLNSLQSGSPAPAAAVLNSEKVDENDNDDHNMKPSHKNNVHNLNGH